MSRLLRFAVPDKLSSCGRKFRLEQSLRQTQSTSVCRSSFELDKSGLIWPIPKLVQMFCLSKRIQQPL